MRALSIGLLLLLASCGPRISAGDPAELRASARECAALQSPQSRPRFVQSMRALVGGRFEDAPAADLQHEDPLHGLTIMPGDLERLDGLSCDEILRLGYEARLRRLDDWLAWAPGGLARARTAHAGARQTLSAIVIRDPRFELADDMIRTPVLHFTIVNNGNSTLHQLVLRAILTAPGEARPLADETLNYRIEQPLAPGETRDLMLSTIFGAFGNRVLADRPDAQLALRVVNIRNASGEPLLREEAEDPDALARELVTNRALRDRLVAERDAL